MALVVARQVLVFIAICIWLAEGQNKDHPMKKVGQLLTKLYNEREGISNEVGVVQGRSDLDISDSVNYEELFDVQRGYVQIELVATDEGPDLEALLDEAGDLGFILITTYEKVAAGMIKVKRLAELCNCEALAFARPVLSQFNAGSVLSEGVKAMQANRVQQKFGLDGNGVTVGVLSNSFNNLDGARTDIATRDLPPRKRINIVKDRGDTQSGDPYREYFYYYEYYDEDNIPPGNDEGRAIMQLIHDVAPGADLAFHTTGPGEASFAKAILTMAEVGCDVLVDDVTFFFAPWFQDGIAARTIDRVTKECGIAYFSSAGNSDRNSYESEFVDSGGYDDDFISTLHDFNPDPDMVDTKLEIFLPKVDQIAIGLQWDEPYLSAFTSSPGSASNLDLYLSEPSLGVVAEANFDDVGGDPVEVLFVNVTNLAEMIDMDDADGLKFDLEVVLTEGPPPGLLKIIIFRRDAEILEYATNSSTVTGHANAASNAAIGASEWPNTPPFGQEPPLVSSLSSAGGTPILFDVNGRRLKRPEIRKQPLVVGPEGTSTTFFGRDVEGFPNPLFFGTSASAPHAAAVAALMLEKDPCLSPKKIFKILGKTAIDMDDPSTPEFDEGFDFGTGFGFVDSLAAVKEVIRHNKKKPRNCNKKPNTCKKKKKKTSKGGKKGQQGKKGGKEGQEGKKGKKQMN